MKRKWAILFTFCLSVVLCWHPMTVLGEESVEKSGEVIVMYDPSDKAEESEPSNRLYLPKIAEPNPKGYSLIDKGKNASFFPKTNERLSFWGLLGDIFIVGALFLYVVFCTGKKGDK